MSTFEILPYTSESVVAIAAIQKSLDTRKYNHYIKPIGKLSQGGMCSLSHVEITTDYNKAIEKGFVPPSYWLEEQKKAASNRFKREVDKCS